MRNFADQGGIIEQQVDVLKVLNHSRKDVFVNLRRIALPLIQRCLPSVVVDLETRDRAIVTLKVEIQNGRMLSHHSRYTLRTLSIVIRVKDGANAMEIYSLMNGSVLS